MLTTTTSTPLLKISLGRSGFRPSDTITTTASSLYDNLNVDQQQVVEGQLAPLINHWTPADATALIHALIASFSVILVSELGDKTFIITAIMAMKNSRLLVFVASALALFSMSVLSVGMGVAVTVIPKIYTHYASIVLFLCFGLKMLKEAHDLKNEGEESEFDEVQRSLEEEQKAEKDLKPQQTTEEMTNKEGLLESNITSKQVVSQEISKPESNFFLVLTNLVKKLYVAPLVIKVFTMVFVAEWGDRSQISTVILAAREDVVGVFVGSFGGHVLCTGLAVIGGRFAADMISVRTSESLDIFYKFVKHQMQLKLY